MAGVDRQLKLAMTGSQGAGNMGIGCQAIGSPLILIKMDAGQGEYGFPGTGMQEAAGSPGIANNLYGEKVMKKGKAIISMGLILPCFLYVQRVRPAAGLRAGSLLFLLFRLFRRQPLLLSL